jgi:hypothetical protein
MNAMNHAQIRSTLDDLMQDGVIHGWGQDALTKRYNIAVSESDNRKNLRIVDAWTLIGKLKPGSVADTSGS